MGAVLGSCKAPNNVDKCSQTYEHHFEDLPKVDKSTSSYCIRLNYQNDRIIWEKESLIWNEDEVLHECRECDLGHTKFYYNYNNPANRGQPTLPAQETITHYIHTDLLEPLENHVFSFCDAIIESKRQRTNNGGNAHANAEANANPRYWHQAGPSYHRRCNCTSPSCPNQWNCQCGHGMRQNMHRD